MKDLLIMAKSLGGGGSEVALIELINALPEAHYNITLVLLDSDNEYAYRLKKNVNIVQLTFNSSFAKSLVSMYAFPAKVLKKLSINSFIPYYDFVSNCVTNVFEKTYDIAIDFYGYGSFVTAFLATKIRAKKKATWLHDEKPYWMKSVQKYLCKYDKVYGVSQAVVDAFCREYPHYKGKTAVFYNVIDIEEIKRKSEQDEVIPFKDAFLGIAIFVVLRCILKCMLERRTPSKIVGFIVKLSDKYSYEGYLVHRFFVLGPMTMMHLTNCTGVNILAILITTLLLGFWLKKCDKYYE